MTVFGEELTDEVLNVRGVGNGVCTDGTAGDDECIESVLVVD